MAQAKKMNESTFAKLVKEFHAVGELIRARQEEKQAIMDSFDLEKKRYSAGKISTKALESSVRKTNKELLRLDKELRRCIARVNAIGDASKRLASQQAPKVFRAKVSGIFLLNPKRKRKRAVKRVVKKKKKAAVRKKKAVKRVVKKAVKRTVKKKKRKAAVRRKKVRKKVSRRKKAKKKVVKKKK